MLAVYFIASATQSSYLPESSTNDVSPVDSRPTGQTYVSK